MRLFVALDLDLSIATRLHEALESWRRMAPQARWTRIESLHLTLKFIGEVPAEMETDIIAALQEIRPSSFLLEMSGLGAFPRPEQARVFWAGIQPSPALEQLAGAIEQRLIPLGIAAEARRFSPHLTLARSRTPAELRPLLPLFRGEPPLWGYQTADRFFLYQSHPTRGSYQYEKRHEFRLTPSSKPDSNSPQK